jgi:hypothetical protein
VPRDTTIYAQPGEQYIIAAPAGAKITSTNTGTSIRAVVTGVTIPAPPPEEVVPPPPPIIIPPGEFPPPPPVSATTFEGFGARATGSSASVVHVTNLNDSGTGSFRAAIAGGNRHIVFDVGGVIAPSGAASLEMLGDNVFVDGLSAPSPGITISTDLRIANRRNVIVQGIRNRFVVHSPVAQKFDDGVTIRRSQDIIVDRCSFSNWMWIGIDVPDFSQNVTISRNIVWRSAPQNDNGGHESKSIMTSFNGSTRISAHHNLMFCEPGDMGFANGFSYRHPKDNYAETNSGLLGKLSTVTTDARCNLVWAPSAAFGASADVRANVNVVRNYFYLGENGANNLLETVNNSGANIYGTENYSRTGGTWATNYPAPSPFAVDSYAQIGMESTALAAAENVMATAGARGPNFSFDASDSYIWNRVNSQGL